MSLGMRIVDNTAFVYIDKMNFNFPEGIRRGLFEAGPIIQRTMIKRIIDPPKTGKLYFIHGQVHRASAPGESPANLTGNLAKSTAYEVSGSSQLTVGVTYQAPYAQWLEGFVVNRIAPRPFIRPAIESNEREIVQSIEKHVLIQMSKK